MEKNRVCVLCWYGPFKDLAELKEWENKKGNDTYLYIFQGKKKRAKKTTTFYCGQAFKQSAGTRMKNQNHHIKEVCDRPEDLKIWVAKFENIVPKKTDVNVVENMLISYIYQYMIGKNEEVANKKSLLAPQCQLYIINEWWDKNEKEIGLYPRGSLFSRIPDVIAFYATGSLYTSNKISFRKDLNQ